MKMITIPEEEYLELKDSHEQLMALECGGVDNWEWYDESLSEYRAKKRQEEEQEEGDAI